MSYYITAPPSHGKTLLISVLANMLLMFSDLVNLKTPIEKVYIVCFNGFLSKHAMHYANSDNSIAGMNYNKRINYVTFNELIDANIKYDAKSYCILDEVD